MMDVNYFLDDAQNSRQGQFELDFADVITCFDIDTTTLVTECGRTLIITWNPLGFFRDYEVLFETPLMESHPGMAEEIIAMLKHMDVDGETMQYILERVGMEERINNLKQSNMRVERKDLKVGTTYYIDGMKQTKGLFVGRDDTSIYFDCGKDHTYYHSVMPGREHLVSFNLEGEGFEKRK